MDESQLDRNLRKYPKLKHLMNKDFTSQSRFLESIAKQAEVRPLSYTQALKSCMVIDEKLTQRKRYVPEESSGYCN